MVQAHWHRLCAAILLCQALSFAADCDITRFGATGKGKSLDTVAIQKAIDSCAAQGGGRVVFPVGRYLSGTLTLKSNITLYLDPGAVLLGSTNIEDYNPKHLIYADGVENIAIEGGGAIDGQGDSFFDENWKARPHPSPLIEIWNSHDIRIQDVTIRKSPGWTIHPKNCDRVKIRGITLLNNKRAINTDGIDPDSSRNVIISDSYIEAGDDSIVLKTTNRRGISTPCENVTVTNCVLLSAASALKLGTESYGDFRHIVFSNITIRESRTGIALLAKDGGTVEDVRFANITMQTEPKWRKGVEWPIEIDIEKRAVDSKISHIRDVTLSGITMATKGRVLLEGMPESLLEAIHLNDIVMRISGYEEIRNAHKLRGGDGGTADAPDFGSVPAAIIAANAKGLDLNGIWVHWPEQEQKDRNGIFLHNAGEVSTSNLHAPASGGGQAILKQ